MTKNKKLTVCITAFLIITCNFGSSQTTTNNNNNNNMRKFNLNLKEFKYEGEYSNSDEIRREAERRRKNDSVESATNGTYFLGRRMLIKGDIVRHLDDDENYYLITEQINKSAFTTVKKYSKPSLTLTIEGQRFYDMPVGLWKYYDDEGNLIKTRDFDKEWGGSFSIEMLIDKFKKEYDVDLSVPKNSGMKVLRDSEDNKPVYVVRIPVNDYPMAPRRVIKVDGKTGRVISDQIEIIDIE